ncbi:3-oxo-5-alpha-steroid 4-dehydrogenase [Hirsutella rhossiliensis]
MSLLDGWLPPTRAHYGLILKLWQFAYPAIGSLQWVIGWYGMGKTSTPSRLNLPGRAAWMTMEAPGFLTLLYVMRTLPAQHGIDDLPWQNRVLAGLFVIHYTYRALLFPLLQPSMAPIHVLVWAMALGFQLLNATCLGAWLAAYGPVTADAWAAQSPLPQFALGLAVFYAGLSANFFHDEELREIRRRRQRREQQQGCSSKDNNKAGRGATTNYYEIPQAGLFRYMLFPHYLCEWVEWAGFLMAAGWSCAPAWAFLTNEVCSMLPRAVRGKAWYVERFGREKVGRKWAVIPGVW